MRAPSLECRHRTPHCCGHIRRAQQGKAVTGQADRLHSPIQQTAAPRRACCAALTAQRQAGAEQLSEQVRRLDGWLRDAHGVGRAQLALEHTVGLYATQEEFRAARPVQQGEALLELPAELGITAADVRSDPATAGLAEGRGELVCLALWLMAERAKGPASSWHTFLESLPQQTESPILWSQAERQELLRGTPVLDEAVSRAAAIDAEWEAVAAICSAAPGQYPPSTFNADAFRRAMSVAFAHAAFLPSAQCFALLPVATLLPRSGREDAAQLDFDLDAQTARLTAARPYRQGEAVALYDGRPSGELLLATGGLEDGNPADCLVLRYSLVKSDRLFSAKKMILESLGFGIDEEFPVSADRMPLQLLAYLRLVRLQDPAQLPLISFERDAVVSQNNEYEILQLLMSDCRERLTNFPSTMEELGKRLQQTDLSPRERLAARLVLAEQRILQGTVDAVRRRLAPIRGIPTKSGGMTDPNEDLREIFDTIEAIPQAPARLLGGLMSWARGEQDPTWKRGKKKQPPPPR